VSACLSTTLPPPSLPALSLRDALPISVRQQRQRLLDGEEAAAQIDVVDMVPLLGRHLGCGRKGTDAGIDEQDIELAVRRLDGRQDRKSTRLNSSHVKTSYAVFCLKKKT